MESIEKSPIEHKLDRVREPFGQFLRTQTFASALLLSSLVAALLMINIGWEDAYRQIQEFTFAVQVGDWRISGNLLGWMNDGLIAVFFFLIGLEIKREFLVGELRHRERRLLLFAGALGGMSLPAAIYLLVNAYAADGATHGWAVPMATDTALAIGIMAMLRNRIPASLTALLVGLAIVDDIGAVLVIALFYTESLAWLPLVIALLVLGLLVFANYAGLRHPLLYLGGALALWISVHAGGVHASIAGVLAAMTVPARPRLEGRRLAQSVRRLYRNMRDRLGRSNVLADDDQHDGIRALESEARRATTPLRRWEDDLELPVALLILPGFAFLNGGIPVSLTALGDLWSSPIALGVVAGLVVGKPLGIIAALFLITHSGAAKLPQAVQWRHLWGMGLVAGIGFTMSTFIGHLAFRGDAESVELAKLAILLASLLAGVLGFLVLWSASRKNAAASSP